MSQGEGDRPATLQHAASRRSSAHGKDSELLRRPPYSLDLAALILLSLHVHNCVASTVWPSKQLTKAADCHLWTDEMGKGFLRLLEVC
jgi:hypothetical protein